MISWIQKYFQHHFRTIFAIILGLMIVSFVFTIGPSGLGRANSRGAVERRLFGYNINSTEGQQRLMGDANLSVSLQMGSMAGLEPEQVQHYALQRAAALHLADQLHLPAPTGGEITDFIKTLRMFAGQDGQFDAKAYQTFRDNLKGGSRLTEADIARVLADDVRAQKVQTLLGGPGYVLPADVKLQLERSDTTWTLATASVNYASFAPDLKPSEADLTKFFDENGFRYEIQPRVVASYLAFQSVSYVGNVTVTDDEVRKYYDANPARFPKPTDPKNPAAQKEIKSDPTLDFALVRPQVEMALKLERAQRLATTAASDLVLAVYNSKVANGPDLDALLAEHKLTAKPMAPFTRESGPVEFGGSPEISDAGFKLDEKRFYSDPVPSAAGAVVLFLKQTLPSRKPEFGEVRAKVLADYVENEKRKRFVDLGKSLRTQLEARLKAGDTFEKAVAAVASSAGVKIEVKTLPAFTARTRPQDLDYSILGALEHLEKGQLSDMSVAADKGIFVYASDKKAPDLSETNPQYAATRAQLATYTARLGSGSVLGEIVEKEVKLSEPKAE